MASVKERQRWERWYDKVTERMQRQVTSINRLVLLLTEAMAALEEIADAEVPEIHGVEVARLRDRAKEALDRIKDPAAAVAQTTRESEQEPVPDPRSGK